MADLEKRIKKLEKIMAEELKKEDKLVVSQTKNCIQESKLNLNRYKCKRLRASILTQD